jgi:hypothetical protein
VPLLKPQPLLQQLLLLPGQQGHGRLLLLLDWMLLLL